MDTKAPSTLESDLGEALQPLRGGSEDFDALVALIGDAQLILIGEA